MRELIPEHAQRLTWSRERLARHQRDELRNIVALARQRSPWHRSRLRRVDPRTLEVADLPSLPVMTKQDVMRNWDGIITIPGISLARCAAYLDAQADFGYLDDAGTQVFTSGGSSGRRGIYAWDEAFFATTASVAFRYQHRDQQARGELGKPRRRGVIMAGKPPHAGTPLFATNLDPAEEVTVCSVLLPFDDLLAQTAAAMPDHLIGYPSMIHRLAGAQARGKLGIAPQRVSTNSEPLTADARTAFTTVWGATVNNMWGSTEVGMHAIACDQSPGLHLSEDVLIVERVDAAGEPVPDASPAARLLVTSLVNTTFPFLRYRLDDSVSLLGSACPCGSPFRLIADVLGRADDDFVYAGSVRVPTVAFRHALSPVITVEEFQVRQTERGAVVSYVGTIDDPPAVRDMLVSALEAHGLTRPEVTLEATGSLARNPRTGKLRRFVPLPRR